jgi:hypothetical protein
MTMDGESPSIGGDPEFFIYQKTDKGKLKLITADKVLGGKQNKEHTDSGSCFFDGVQAEINPSHSSCREFFGRNIVRCLERIRRIASSKLKCKESDIVFAPLASIDITKKDLKNSDKECFRFGCAPDYCIYDRPKDFKYPDGKKYMKRFSGGHIHLGFDSIGYQRKMKTPEKMLALIKLADYLVGVPAVAISNGEEEIERRNYYGLAGTYRIQPHGIEYRTLSSFWMVAPPLMSLMTGLLRDAFSIAYNDLEDEVLEEIDQDEVKRIIDESDIKAAREMWKDIYKTLTKYNFHNSPVKPHTKYNITKMINKGYRTFFEPTKMLHYWSITDPVMYTGSASRGYYGISRFSTRSIREKKRRDNSLKEIKELK